MEMFTCFYFLLTICSCTVRTFEEDNPFFWLWRKDHCQRAKSGDYCTWNDKPGIRNTVLGDLKLARLEDIGVGKSKIVHLPGGIDLELRVANSKPLIFEIDNFLTKEECAYFINVAKNKGLRSSETASSDGVGNRFVLMDTDRDGNLDVHELRLTIENSLDVYMDSDDVLALIEEKRLDPDKDGLISKAEFTAGVSPYTLKKYTDELIKRHPEKHSRYSKQVWLFADTSADKRFKKLQDKVSLVTQLPRNLIRMADFQVVNYGINGHYNAHWDSATVDKTVPCCIRNMGRACRICRYMTILFYLNDVEEGGGTAFPIANNATMDYQYIRQQQLVNLYRKCQDANLIVRPSKGKAIIWYNHFVDEENGWLGEMDNFTLHGGCAVIKGEKWIANFWVKVTDNKQNDIHKMKSFK